MRTILTATLICWAALPAPAAEETRPFTLRLTVAAAGTPGEHVPVSAAIELPEALARARHGVDVRLTGEGADEPVPCQLVVGPDKAARLWWIVPATGKPSSWTAALSPRPQPTKDEKAADEKAKAAPPRAFAVKDAERDHLDVLFAGRPVVRYMYAFDTSTPQRAHETYKVYHHVFDGAGEKLLTKGPGGQYTHHRGVFLGFSRLRAGDGRGDYWHMKNVTQRHQRMLEALAGPVLARHTASVQWADSHRRAVIDEKRTVTVFRQPAPTICLLEFRSELTPAGEDPVTLDGDPEHAGFQFRAHNDLSRGSRKDERGKPLTSRAGYLFPADKVDLKKELNLPWAAMTFVLHGKKYAVQHMNHPDNPPGRYSAYRPYGRFGHFPRATVAAGKTLTLRYRICVDEGQVPSRARMDARRAAFADPPDVAVKPAATD